MATPGSITEVQLPRHVNSNYNITTKTIGKTILPTSCQNYAAPCVTNTIGKIIWLREMLMLKGKVKVVPSKMLHFAKQARINKLIN